MSKYREFLLSKKTQKYSLINKDNRKIYSDPRRTLIHVIEYQAYSELKSKAEKLVEILKVLVDECRFENPNTILTEQALKEWNEE